MARKRNKKTRVKAKTESRQASGEPEPIGWVGKAALAFFAVVVTAVGIVYGLTALDLHVHTSDRFQGPPQVTLVDVPENLQGVISRRIAPLLDTRWSDPQLCRRIVEALSGEVWVREVVRVAKGPDGRVDVECRYRKPTALVQSSHGFIAIDADQVHLSQVREIPSDCGLKIIQGVQGLAPEYGQIWDAPDLRAGLDVLEVLRSEPFAEQIVAVGVHNYGGRADSKLAHVELATDRVGGRIIWGSAPGEEVEENSVAQKLAILRANHERSGRVDAGYAVIDVSTFPDRFTTPMASMGQVADSGNRM